MQSDPQQNSQPHPQEQEPVLEAVEEEAAMPASRVRDDSEMDITPMIDMTFLLLIFFVVCSKMDPGSEVTLPPARHGETLSTANAIVFTVSSQGDESVIYKGEGKVEANALSGATPSEKETQVAAYVEEQLAANPNLTEVLIMAEAAAKHRDVALVMKAAAMAQADGAQLHVGVMEMP
jgi:biopolymer transport protein ExbD